MENNLVSRLGQLEEQGKTKVEGTWRLLDTVNAIQRLLDTVNAIKDTGELLLQMI